MVTQEQSTLGIITYRNFTLADGLAKVLLNHFAGIPIYEILVKPDTIVTPKSNRKSSKAPEIKICKIYPNPSKGIVLIEVPAVFESLHVTVVDNGGKIVLTTQVNAGLATLNMRHLPTGSYIISIDSKEGKLRESHQIQIVR